MKQKIIPLFTRLIPTQFFSFLQYSNITNNKLNYSLCNSLLCHAKMDLHTGIQDPKLAGKMPRHSVRPKLTLIRHLENLSRHKLKK